MAGVKTWLARLWGSPAEPQSLSYVHMGNAEPGFLESKPGGQYDVTSDTLRALASVYWTIRAAVNFRKAEVRQTQWSVVCKRDTKGVRKKAEQIERLFYSPEPGVSGTRFVTWIDMLVEDILVLDAGAFEILRKNGKVNALRLVDGATIMPVSNERGDLHPDVPYVQQVLNSSGDSGVSGGAGGSDMRESRGEGTLEEGIKSLEKQGYRAYRPGQLVYIRNHPRTNSHYGISPVESLISWVAAGLHGARHIMKGVNSKKIPEGFFNLGEGVSQEEVDRFQVWWDTMVSQRERKIFAISGGRGTGFMPFDRQRVDPGIMNMLKQVDYMVCMLMGVRPGELGVEVTGPKYANIEQMWTQKRVGLLPLLELLADIFNGDVIVESFGLEPGEVEFRWQGIELRDKQRMADLHTKYLGRGAITLREVREELGLSVVRRDGNELEESLLDYLLLPLGSALLVLGYLGEGEPQWKPGDMIPAQQEEGGESGGGGDGGQGGMAGAMAGLAGAAGGGGNGGGVVPGGNENTGSGDVGEGLRPSELQTEGEESEPGAGIDEGEKGG